jgi:hypothetical protein
VNTSRGSVSRVRSSRSRSGQRASEHGLRRVVIARVEHRYRFACERQRLEIQRCGEERASLGIHQVAGRCVTTRRGGGTSVRGSEPSAGATMTRDSFGMPAAVAVSTNNAPRSLGRRYGIRWLLILRGAP